MKQTVKVMSDRKIFSKDLHSNNERLRDSLPVQRISVVGSMEAPSRVFLLFFLLLDWLKLNHLKSRMECGFSDIFSRHISSTVAETIGVQTTQQVLARKNVQKTKFEAAEMMLGPWNQQSNSHKISI